MAIQAQMYPENLGLPLMGGSQDWLFMANNNLNNFNNSLSNTNNTSNNTNNNNNNIVFNGCGFNEFSCSNNLQQHKQQQQFQFQQQQQQQQVLLQFQQQYLQQLQNQQQRNSSCENNNNDGFVFLSSSKNYTSTTTASTTTTTGSDYNQPMNFSPCFTDHLEKQRQEIDRFITLQNERLKLALQEQRKQQLSTLMRKLEAKTMQVLSQKDEEIARATKRTIELENIITRMEFENQEWQRLAAENEAMLNSLNNTLEQLKEQACCTTTSSSCSSNEVEDAESCCNVVGVVNNNESFSNNSGKHERNTGMVLCKVCKTGKSCILLLPCRHLCCCKGCEAFVDVCPVCKSAKIASIEALIS